MSSLVLFGSAGMEYQVGSKAEICILFVVVVPLQVLFVVIVIVVLRLRGKRGGDVEGQEGQEWTSVCERGRREHERTSRNQSNALINCH